jgi:hypothetical protein
VFGREESGECFVEEKPDLWTNPSRSAVADGVPQGKKHHDVFVADYPENSIDTKCSFSTFTPCNQNGWGAGVVRVPKNFRRQGRLVNHRSLRKVRSLRFFEVGAAADMVSAVPQILQVVKE